LCVQVEAFRDGTLADVSVQVVLAHPARRALERCRISRDPHDYVPAAGNPHE
jgi:hypothetical protein